MKKIYLDHAATTPLDPEVLKTMLPYLQENYGNASSLHSFGQEASKGVENARYQVAKFLNCQDDEIIFTSGATESNNMVILGVAQALQRRYPSEQKLHIITSQIEHPAILEPCQKLDKNKFEVTSLPINNQGLVELETLKQAIQDNTVLISIMYANNEIGTIQPIAEIGEFLEKLNQERSVKKLSNIVFHTDAVQTVAYCDCDVVKLKVDLLSLSGHKFYGPKGVGTLFMKKGTPFLPIITGGHQEQNKRSGTHNTPSIVGLGQAIELLQQPEHQESILKIKKLRDYLESKIQQEIPNTQINGDLNHRLPSHSNISFAGAEGESMLIMLDMEGVAISTGSACSSGSLKPSHVLLALGLPPELCHSSLRFTLGKQTTPEEVDYTVEQLSKIIKKLREMAPKTM